GGAARAGADRWTKVPGGLRLGGQEQLGNLAGLRRPAWAAGQLRQRLGRGDRGQSRRAGAEGLAVRHPTDPGRLGGHRATVAGDGGRAVRDDRQRQDRSRDRPALRTWRSRRGTAFAGRGPYHGVDDSVAVKLEL